VSAEENKASVRYFLEEAHNKGNLSVVEQLFDANLIVNGHMAGSDAVRQVVTRLRTAFPDLHVTVEDQVAEGDKVSTRRTWHGTHLGALETVIGRIPPSGKRVAWTGINLVRFANGKIVEDWISRDDLGLLQQLGVIPPPEQKAPK
jgi:steroid delta-isomerase-like uncharacterized protein